MMTCFPREAAYSLLPLHLLFQIQALLLVLVLAELAELQLAPVNLPARPTQQHSPLMANCSLLLPLLLVLRQAQHG